MRRLPGRRGRRAHRGPLPGARRPGPRDLDAGRPLPRSRHELLRAASWRAARSGLEGDLVDLDGDSPSSSPPQLPIGRLVHELRPTWRRSATGSRSLALSRGHAHDGQRRRPPAPHVRPPRRADDVVDALIARTQGRDPALEPPDTVPVRPDLLAAYHPDAYDEAVAADGEVRPEYGWMFRALSRMGTRGLAAAETALRTEQTRARRHVPGRRRRARPAVPARPRAAHRHRGRLGGPLRRAHAAGAGARGVPPRRLRPAAHHRRRGDPRVDHRRRARLEPAGHPRARRCRAHRGGGHRPRARPGRPLARAGGQPARALGHRVRDHVPAAHPQRDARPGGPGGRRRAGGRGGAAAQCADRGDQPGPAGPRRGRPAVDRPDRLGVLRAPAARRPHGRAGGDATRPAGDRRRRLPRRGGRQAPAVRAVPAHRRAARCSPRKAPTCVRSGAPSATRRPAGGSRWSTRWATGWRTTRSSTPTSPR